MFHPSDFIKLPAVPSRDLHHDIFFGNSTYSQRFPQLYERYPALAPFYLDYEKNFQDSIQYSLWFNGNYQIPLALSSLYLVVIFGLRALIRAKFGDKPAYSLRGPFGIWNLICAIFSLFCALRTVPHHISVLLNDGYFASVCGDGAHYYGFSASGLWTFYFIVSKIPELLDTIFIVLKNKGWNFLHWYHHCTVLLFCWHSYATRSGSGLWFVAMNSTVHTVMYYYFFLTCNGYKPKWDWIVTTMQISQMFIGIIVCVSTYVFWSQGATCYVHPDNWVWGFLMYLSYLLLFVQFAVRRYCCSTNKGGKEKSEKPKKKKGD